MFPGFTAEAGLLAAGGRYRRSVFDASVDRTLSPQYRGVRRMNETMEPGGAEAVQTCTCPCCITYNGRLVCC